MTELARQKAKSRIAWTIAIVFALAYLVVSVLPFIFMVLNSFKGRFEMFLKGVFAMPESFDFSNYRQVLTGNFFRYFGNSLIVLAVSLVLLLFITSCASYPLARFQFKLSKPIYSLIVACMTIPIHITLIPVFKMSQTTGLYDSIWALIGPYVAFALPISVFILTGQARKGNDRGRCQGVGALILLNILL